MTQDFARFGFTGTGATKKTRNARGFEPEAGLKDELLTPTPLEIP